MTKERKPLKPAEIIDEMAAKTLTASEEDLRNDLADAGIDPDVELHRLRASAADIVAEHRKKRVRGLPNEVPGDAKAVRELLDQLLALPHAPRDGFTLAYREKSSLSDHDLRVLAENLLELLRKEYGS